jgi:hypothetical protein
MAATAVHAPPAELRWLRPDGLEEWCSGLWSHSGLLKKCGGVASASTFAAGSRLLPISPLRICQKEVVRGPRHCHVQQAPLLLDVLAGARDQVLLDTHKNRCLDGKTLGSGHDHEPHAATLGPSKVFAERGELRYESSEVLALFDDPLDTVHEETKLVRQPRKMSGRCLLVDPDRPDRFLITVGTDT